MFSLTCQYAVFLRNRPQIRVICYNLILKVIVKFYKPGTKQEDFEKKCSEVIDDINEDVKTHFVETEDDEEDLEQVEDTNSVTESILGSLISSKCDSDVANLKEVDDDNKGDDDDVNSNDINNFEEDTESIDEETDSNTLAKTENEVKKVLSKHNNPVACDLCGELMKNEKGVIPSNQYALSSPQANIEPIIKQPKSRKRKRQNEDSLPPLFEFPKQKVRKDVSTRLQDLSSKLSDSDLHYLVDLFLINLIND
ncbi:unnamed protein product [Brachionus calyciflorus]|uniref:Uncharacterized protein n=1 Tax=Brachionus calyciflorus TaxID=104777 RepID=A0A814KW37_9BILA|nr:unnamed protein product [Brachionus calyciflorus]